MLKQKLSKWISWGTEPTKDPLGFRVPETTAALAGPRPPAHCENRCCQMDTVVPTNICRPAKVISCHLSEHVAEGTQRNPSRNRAEPEFWHIWLPGQAATQSGKQQEKVAWPDLPPPPPLWPGHFLFDRDPLLLPTWLRHLKTPPDTQTQPPLVDCFLVMGFPFLSPDAGVVMWQAYHQSRLRNKRLHSC